MGGEKKENNRELFIYYSEMQGVRIQKCWDSLYAAPECSEVICETISAEVLLKGIENRQTALKNGQVLQFILFF